MARFIDRHPAEAVPSEAFGRLIREAEEHRRDPRGVRLVGHWLGDARLHCVLEAPDAESVRQYHAERGLPCEDLHELTGVPGGGPMAAEDDDHLVRATIAGIWPGLRVARARHHGRSPRGDQAAKRVLVVDDEETIRLTVAEALEDEGYEVVTAQNGAEALDRVRVTEPDALVLDLMMPVLDGWGFLQACRQEALCASIPVLVMSAYRKLAEAGPAELRVDRVVAKPFELEALLMAVEELVA